MGKKSKKRRRKSRSSSEEDNAEESRGSRDLEHYKRKRKSSKESSAAKLATHVFPTTSQSARQIKKPVYKLEKSKATEEKSVNKEDRWAETKKTYATSHAGNSSSKAANYISGKCSSFSGRKTMESGSTKSQNNSTVDTGRSKDSIDRQSSHWKLWKSNKQLTRSSLVSVKGNEQAKEVKLKNEKSKKSAGTRGDDRGVKTKKPYQTCKDSVQSTNSKVVKHCRLPQGNIFKATGSASSEAKTLSVSAAKYPISCTTATSVSHTPVVKFTIKSQKTAKPSQQLCPFTPTQHHNFKIPKKVQPKTTSGTSEAADAAHTEHKVKLPQSATGSSSSKQAVGHQAPSCRSATLSFSHEEREKRPSLSGSLPAPADSVAKHDQIQVIEELQLARSERRLELDVTQSYGELTAMDIDPPEEGAADWHCKQRQNPIIALDTNILLSHLDYVEKIMSHGLGALGLPIILIPWVVLQELDSLKKGRGLSGSVAHLAIPAISYIYNSLKSREPRLWGQSMQQARKGIDGLNAENNDDRVLQCCLQYQGLYPECALILCTNDKNLCSKALLSGVKALSKNDLETEVSGSARGFGPLQNIKSCILPHASSQLSSPMLSTTRAPSEPRCQERAGLPVGPAEKGDNSFSTSEDGGDAEWLSGCVSELEDCLQTVLSHVLEAEMKAAYDELWLEIVYKKPPWTLQGVLQCLKKHWIAVFGQIVPRNKLDAVLSLIGFFKSGKRADRSTTVAAVQEARELVNAFAARSSRVPGALSKMDSILSKLQPQVTDVPSSCSLNPEGQKCTQGKFPECDVVMNDDDDEDKQPACNQVLHRDVWALFENIWSGLFEMSLKVFKAVGFDPHAMQSARPAGGPPPPQDALACLHALSTMVSQLLHAFSSILSSHSSSEEVQTLLSNLYTNEIVSVDSRLTAKDILDCFSQQDYREKLRVGGNQLMDLKGALDRCVEALGFTPHH